MAMDIALFTGDLKADNERLRGLLREAQDGDFGECVMGSDWHARVRSELGATVQPQAASWAEQAYERARENGERAERRRALLARAVPYLDRGLESLHAEIAAELDSTTFKSSLGR